MVNSDACPRPAAQVKALDSQLERLDPRKSDGERAALAFFGEAADGAGGGGSSSDDGDDGEDGEGGAGQQLERQPDTAPGIESAAPLQRAPLAGPGARPRSAGVVSRTVELGALGRDRPRSAAELSGGGGVADTVRRMSQEADAAAEARAAAALRVPAASWGAKGGGQVSTTPSWPRTWANFSPL